MKIRALVLIAALVVQIAPTHADVITIGVAYDTGGLGDLSYNDAVAAGIALETKKGKNFSIEVAVTDGSAMDRESRLRALIKKGANPIIAVGKDYAPAVAKLSLESPELHFAVMNDASVDGVNVSGIVFSEVQGAFLAGVAAAFASKSGIVGMIATNSQSTLYEKGFKAGVLASKKKIKMSVQYVSTNSTGAAKKLIASGADVIFISVPGSITDVFEVVVKANTSKRTVGLINFEPDQFLSLTQSTKNYLYATVEKKVNIAMRDWIDISLQGGQFLDFLDEENGIYGRRYGITNKGIEIALHLSRLAAQADAINIAASPAAKIAA